MKNILKPKSAKKNMLKRKRYKNDVQRDYLERKYGYTVSKLKKAMPTLRHALPFVHGKGVALMEDTVYITRNLDDVDIRKVRGYTISHRRIQYSY